MSLNQPDASDRLRLASILSRQRNRILSDWQRNQFQPSLLSRFNIGSASRLDSQVILETYLRPVFELFVEYVRTGDIALANIYLNERLRYAPRPSSRPSRQDFFHEVLHSDEESVLKSIPADCTLRTLLEAEMLAIHAHLRAPADKNPVRVLGVGDCLMTEVRSHLAGRCRLRALPLEFEHVYFSGVMNFHYSDERVLNAISRFNPDIIAFSFLSYQGLPVYRSLLMESEFKAKSRIQDRIDNLLELIRGYLGQIRATADQTFLLHNTCGLPLSDFRSKAIGLAPHSRRRQWILDQLNTGIAEIAKQIPGTIFFDEEAVASRYGHRHCNKSIIPLRISKNSVFHTKKIEQYIADSYADIVDAFHTLKKTKVLLLDFDNTLWQGVMADGEVCQYTAFQETVLELKKAGILLVAVSKNSPENIRWHEMLLKEDDFILLKINWNPKVRSIIETAEQLNLGLDSFVFIDDNPVELELVKTALPLVRTLNSTDPLTPEYLKYLLEFPNVRKTEESQNRTDMYRAQVKRQGAMARDVDQNSMLSSLGLKVKFGKASHKDLNRLVELVQRTNQFNTTTIRYSRHELMQLLESDDAAVYVASLTDKFGDVGQVCAVIIRRQDTDRIFDSFVMSCRAMGFDLEKLVLRLVLEEERSDTGRFIGLFSPTDKNSPSRNLFSACHFVAAGENQWELGMDSRWPELPPWFDVSVL